MLLVLGAGAAAASLAHCGGDDDDLARPSKPGTGTTTQHVCTSPKKLTVGQLHPSEKYEGALEGTATAADSTTWTVRIMLEDSADSKTVAGKAYDLSKESATYADCQRCVLGFQGDDFTGASRQLFQTSGTLQLETVSSPPSAVSKGSLTKVLLREVKVDGMEADMADVKGGGCYELDFDWSTLPAPNTKCQSSDDCGGTTCDPVDGTCKAFQCQTETGTGCDDATQVCVPQEYGSTFGACYPRCVPFDSTRGCAADRQCVTSNGDQLEGICLTTGTAAEGQPCESTQLNTGCAAGLLCQGDSDESGTCHRLCNFFGTASECGAGQHCAYGGVCVSEGDPAALGATCGDESGEGTPCGASGGAWQGHCIGISTYPGDGTEEVVTLTCLRPCRDNTVCPTGESCILTETELALPYCQKPEETTP